MSRASDVVTLAERERFRHRPPGRALMGQTWRELLFLHYPVAPESLRNHVPEGLDLDLFPDERGQPMAWIGVVLFAIEALRIHPLPPIPGYAGFAEANVRTYVHRQGRDPSVYFFSLDGGPSLTRWAARAGYGTPYFEAETSLTSRDGVHHFQSRRPDGFGADVTYRPGKPLANSASDSLEFFLLERYLLLAPAGDAFKRGRVHHLPYQPCQVEFDGETDLPASHGLPVRPFTHAVYCDRVVAEFFPPERLG